MSSSDNIDSRAFFITERSVSLGSLCSFGSFGSLCSLNSIETISIGSDSNKEKSDSNKERHNSNDERISESSVDNTMKVSEYKLSNEIMNDNNNRRNRDVYFIYDNFENSKYKNYLINKENYKQDQISSSPNPVKWAGTIASNYFKQMKLPSQYQSKK